LDETTRMELGAVVGSNNLEFDRRGVEILGIDAI
jgi:hypothetical protein